MAYSGTVGQTLTTVQDFIDEGARRAGKLAEELTVEQVQSAKRSLFLLLSSLANKGINYWAINKTVFGLTPNDASYALPVGSVDVLQALYRTITYLAGTYTSSAGGTVAGLSGADLTQYCQQTLPNGNIQVDFGTATVVRSIGIMPYLPSGNATWSYALECSSDGATWIAVQTQTAVAVTDMQWIWADLDPGLVYRYFRVRATGGTTLALRQFALGNVTTEIQMSRLNRDDYTNLPNKGFTANQPFQFWFNRTIPQPQLILWPVPSNAFIQMVVWYSRQIDDIGALSNQIEVPQRWFEAVQMMLSHRMAMSLPGVQMDRILYCEKMAAQYLAEAEEEERDKSPIYVAPNISVYTR